MSETRPVLILDFGSQYTQLIARRVRELGAYSLILPGDAGVETWQSLRPRAVILSGGPSSVYGENAPKLPNGFLAWQSDEKAAVLGVCYGMQLLVHAFGGKVEQATSQEYGRQAVSPVKSAGTLMPESAFQAWMSHGDEIVELPEGFELLAKSESGVAAAVSHRERKIACLQFHPEVSHTEKGTEILSNFLKSFADVPFDWTMECVIEEQVKKIREQAGSEDHAICALSGGVDSAVAAKLVHRVLGDRLHCVFVDNGLLRYQERDRVMKLFRDEFGLEVTAVDAVDRFLTQLSGVIDPEKKRKIIGAEFIRVFEESAESLTQKLGRRPRFLIQGTLYPDVIESSVPEGVKSQFSATIKSHHNVGGLPKDLKFELIEPLRDLFKDEVRRLGKELGVPESFLKRHPFPGPGLAVRVLGEIRREDLDTLRRVDEIFIQSLREFNLYDKIWQAFAVFLPIRSVGVQGDGRTHKNVVGLRAVTSQDGMTADWYPFEPQFLAHVSNRICNEVHEVGRVVYDVSSKPPATIEWE